MDYIETKDRYVEAVCRGDYRDTLISIIYPRYDSCSALDYYYLLDEPEVGNFASNSYLMDFLRNQTPPYKPGIQITWRRNDSTMYKAYVDSVHPNVLQINYYPLRGDWSSQPTPPESGSIFQEHIDGLCNALGEARLVTKQNSSFFYYVCQSFGQYIGDSTAHVREPTPRELKDMIWLALAYGAKGIEHFTYTTIVESPWVDSGLTCNGNPRYPLWTAAKEMNFIMREIGPTLMELTSDTVFLVSDGIPNDCFIKKAWIWNYSDTLIQIGTFHDDNSDYFIMVNRHCLPSETLDVIIGLNDTLLFLYDCYTQATITYEQLIGLPNPPYYYRITLLPGQGRLFRLVPFSEEFEINQGHTYTNMPYAAVKTKATSLLGVDSMVISQKWYDPPETRHDTTTGWISYDTAYVWCLRAGEGINTLYIQYMVDETIISPTYLDSIIFDKTAPTGSFVINNDNKFTNTASVALHNSFSDTTLYKMRYGDTYLKQDLVKNAGFDSDTLWRADTAIYHNDYQLYEIPILATGNSFYQAIPADSLVGYEGDTMYLWIDLVSDDYSGMGKVMFQYIYSDTSDCGTQPYGTSIAISPGTSAKTSWYNMASYFVFQPDTDSVFTEARVGIWVDPGENSGALYIDNFKLDLTGPQYDYSKFEDYDTLKQDWLLYAGNGARTVYGQFSDEAGNETSILFDTIIADTTKPARKIMSPQHGRTVSDTVTITGWAYDYSNPDQHFEQYALQYRSLESEDWYGIDPDSLSTTPVYPLMPPDILGKWNTNSLSDGWYDLRLAVQDSASNYKDTTISVQVDNSAGDGRSLSGFTNEVYGIAVGNELYVSELSTGNVYKFNNEFELVDSFTVSDSLGTGAPLAMRFDINGNIWLTNITSHFINKFSTQGNLLAQFSGNFSLPSGLAFDSAGSIWISDRMHHKIKRYNQTGTMLSSFGTHGSDPGKLDRPLGVAFFKDRVYISDSRNKRISVFDTAGVFVQTIGDSAGLILPFALAVDTTGYLFVTDAFGDQVLEFDPYGNQVYRIDSIFDTPSGIAISPGAEILYVADTKNKRVLAFDIIGEPETGGGPQAIGEAYLNNIMFNIYPTLTLKTLSIRLHGLVDKQVSLKIYDITGRLVKTLCDKTVITSNQTLTWDGKDDRNRSLANGIYFVSLEYDNNRITKKAILLR